MEKCHIYFNSVTSQFLDFFHLDAVSIYQEKISLIFGLFISNLDTKKIKLAELSTVAEYPFGSLADC